MNWSWEKLCEQLPLTPLLTIKEVFLVAPLSAIFDVRQSKRISAKPKNFITFMIELEDLSGAPKTLNNTFTYFTLLYDVERERTIGLYLFSNFHGFYVLLQCIFVGSHTATVSYLL